MENFKEEGTSSGIEKTLLDYRSLYRNISNGNDFVSSNHLEDIGLLINDIVLEELLINSDYSDQCQPPSNIILNRDGYGIIKDGKNHVFYFEFRRGPKICSYSVSIKYEEPVIDKILLRGKYVEKSDKSINGNIRGASIKNIEFINNSQYEFIKRFLTDIRNTFGFVYN